MNFFIPADDKVKMKENEKRDTYLYLAWDLKMHQNDGVTICYQLMLLEKGPQILGMGMEVLEIGGRVETTQTTPLSRSFKILKRFLETWGDLGSLFFLWKTIT